MDADLFNHASDMFGFSFAKRGRKIVRSLVRTRIHIGANMHSKATNAYTTLASSYSNNMPMHTLISCSYLQVTLAEIVAKAKAEGKNVDTTSIAFTLGFLAAAVCFLPSILISEKKSLSAFLMYMAGTQNISSRGISGNIFTNHKSKVRKPRDPC